MLAKMTSKHQITIPKKIIEQLPDVEYFEVELKDGVVMLKPLKVYGTNLGKIRSKIKKLGLQENTVKEAIEWARSKS
jgi:bifunctional DNA-binding transcriptional regulator/antitoxin component of YhaV-PrlF toxin-antitoxin module